MNPIPVYGIARLPCKGIDPVYVVFVIASAPVGNDDAEVVTSAHNLDLPQGDTGKHCLDSRMDVIQFGELGGIFSKYG